MKFFSVEGVNQLIPELEAYILKLQQLKEKVFQKQLHIDTQLIVGGVSDSAVYAPSHEAVQKDVEELNVLVEEFNKILNEMNDLGYQLKDPDTGLIDFYHIKDDEIVVLCWKLGEKKVEHWHTLEGGFSGREKI